LSILTKKYKNMTISLDFKIPKKCRKE